MISIDRRFFRYFDWGGFALILILSAISLLSVYSATYRPASIHGKDLIRYFHKQAFGIGSGLLIFFIMSFIDYRRLQRWGYFLYIATISLLFFTLLKGSIGMGAQRWIDLGFTKFQPSELAKLFFPAFFTYYFAALNQSNMRFRDFIPILIILGISALLILKQPDLGTAIIISFSGLALLWVSGIGNRFFLWLALIFLVTAPLSWAFLKPYQKQRIAVFLGEGNSKKERYQIEQSCIAIGSGGLTGKGFLQGTQNTLQFLPESRTDFIFSVISEEWGFFGTLTLISLYALLFLRWFFIIFTIKDRYAQLLATGLILHIVISTIINIGMVTGLLPIVGIPLPLMSYGSTNLWITFASLGWFNSIAMRRFYQNAL
jgi:rod shape determining protein RodA